MSLLDRLIESGDPEKRIKRFLNAKPLPLPELRQCRCGAHVNAAADYCDYCGYHRTDPHKWVPVR